MEYLKLNTVLEFNGSITNLEKQFDDFIKHNPNTNKFLNTDASIYLIICGSLSYFDKLDSDFLGDSNDDGIPNNAADHFANTFYRLSNSLDYLFSMWHKNESYKHSDNWNFLSDIRTLIVHSGEQITNLNLLKLKGFVNYKDIQLGWLLNTKSSNNCQFMRLCNDDILNFDYLITIWTDKHDSSKSRRENDLNYDNDHENFSDVSILINAKDVKNVVLAEVKQFLDQESGKSIPIKKTKILPKEVKKQVVHDLDFDKLENLIFNRSRGGYVYDNGERWDGFGLKRVMKYVLFRKNSLSDDVRNKIKSIISTRLNEFWNAYNNKSILDDDLPELDIRDVFNEYLPKYHLKYYLEGEKLFNNIVPNFNSKSDDDLVDVDYLLKFIVCIQDALGCSLNLECTADDLICKYIVKSVEKSLLSSDISSNDA